MSLPAVVHTGPPPLSDTEERFCVAYLKHMCATQAYLDVFPNVAKSSATTLGSRLFRKVHIKARIRELVGEVLTGSVMSKQEVLEELSHIGRGDLTDVLVKHPSGLPMIADVKDLPAEVRRTIQSIKVKVGPKGDRVVEFKQHPKIAALEQLSKYHKLYDELLPSGVKEVIVRLVRE